MLSRNDWINLGLFGSLFAVLVALPRIGGSGSLAEKGGPKPPQKGERVIKRRRVERSIELITPEGDEPGEVKVLKETEPVKEYIIRREPPQKGPQYPRTGRGRVFTREPERYEPEEGKRSTVDVFPIEAVGEERSLVGPSKETLGEATSRYGKELDLSWRGKERKPISRRGAPDPTQVAVYPRGTPEQEGFLGRYASEAEKKRLMEERFAQDDAAVRLLRELRKAEARGLAQSTVLRAADPNTVRRLASQDFRDRRPDEKPKDYRDAYAAYLAKNPPLIDLEKGRITGLGLREIESYDGIEPVRSVDFERHRQAIMQLQSSLGMAPTGRIEDPKEEGITVDEKMNRAKLTGAIARWNMASSFAERARRLAREGKPEAAADAEKYRETMFSIMSTIKSFPEEFALDYDRMVAAQKQREEALSAAGESPDIYDERGWLKSEASARDEEMVEDLKRIFGRQSRVSRLGAPRDDEDMFTRLARKKK